MKKSTKIKADKQLTAQVDPYLEGLMGKLLERLTSLESKMDAVLAQASRPAPSSEPQRSFQERRPFQDRKPYQDRGERKNYQSPHQPLKPRHDDRGPKRDRVMHEAVCADCSKVCEVPFKPVEGRSIYCQPCFAKRKVQSGVLHLAPKPVAVYKPQEPVDGPAQASNLASVSPQKEKKAKKFVKKTQKKRK